MADPNQNNNNNNSNENAHEPQLLQQQPQTQHHQDETEDETTEKEVVVSKTYTTNVEPNNPLPLDWTKLGMNNTESDIPPRSPSEVAEWGKEDTEICIVGTSGMKITFLGPDFCDQSKTTNMEGLTSLVLRSHLLKEMSGIGLLPKLETLELYDNMIQKLDAHSLKGCGPTTLRVLDMSYNAIRTMVPLQHCNGDTLTELYLANNKLKEISGISHLKHLRKIDLGANRIRVLPKEELSGLSVLEELWVGKKQDRIPGGNRVPHQAQAAGRAIEPVDEPLQHHQRSLLSERPAGHPRRIVSGAQRPRRRRDLGTGLPGGHRGQHQKLSETHRPRSEPQPIDDHGVAGH